jgi:hypothetical protein
MALTGFAELVERLHEKQPVVIKHDMTLRNMTSNR